MIIMTVIRVFYFFIYLYYVWLVNKRLEPWLKMSFYQWDYVKVFCRNIEDIWRQTHLIYLWMIKIRNDPNKQTSKQIEIGKKGRENINKHKRLLHLFLEENNKSLEVLIHRFFWHCVRKTISRATVQLLLTQLFILLCVLHLPKVSIISVQHLRLVIYL